MDVFFNNYIINLNLNKIKLNKYLIVFAILYKTEQLKFKNILYWNFFRFKDKNNKKFLFFLLLLIWDYLNKICEKNNNYYMIKIFIVNPQF